MVPARNEEKNIAQCLDSLLNQTYQNYEIIVLDDNSTDRTWEILTDYQKRYPHLLRIYRGKPLQEDWYGKPYALQQISEHAVGDIYLFTDADTLHESTSIAFAVTNMTKHQVDYLSAYPRHLVYSFGEKITVPSMYIMTSMVLPLFLVPRTNMPTCSFSIGQYVVFKADVFKKMGGYEALKKEVTDDVLMVRHLKKLGYKTIFIDAKDHVACRMYTSLKEGFVGISRSVFPSVEYNSWQFCSMTIFLFCIVLLPLFILFKQVVTGGEHILLSALPVLLFLSFWTLKMKSRRMLSCAPLYPILFMTLIGMGFLSYIKMGFGNGIAWKGRLVK